MADVDAALVQKILDIPKRKREPDIHHDRQADDFRARLEVAKGRAFCIRLRYKTDQPASSWFCLTRPTRLLPDTAGDPLQIPRRIELHPGALHILLPVPLHATIEAHLIAGETLAQEKGPEGQLRLTLPIGLHRRGGRTDVTTTSKDGPRSAPTLVRALRAAHAMVAREASGLPRIAAAPASPHQRRLIRLAFLSPDLQQSILDGRQPQDLTLARLIRTEIPLCWSAQERMFDRRAE